MRDLQEIAAALIRDIAAVQRMIRNGTCELRTGPQAPSCDGPPSGELVISVPIDEHGVVREPIYAARGFVAPIDLDTWHVRLLNDRGDCMMSFGGRHLAAGQSMRAAWSLADV